MGSVGSNLNSYADKYTSLQQIINDKNLTAKPRVLSDNEFDKSVQSEALDGVVLYRGLSKQTNTGEAYKDELLNGDTYKVGKGGMGEGIYLATNAWTARDYGAVDNLDGTTITAYIDKTKAKEISITKLEQMWNKETGGVRTFRTNANTPLEKFSTEGLSSYAISKGYNVVTDKSSGFYVALTRDVLVVRRNSLVKENAR